MDRTNKSTFEVIFRGSDAEVEDIQMNDMVSTSHSDLEAISLSTGKLHALSPDMEQTTNPDTGNHVFHLEEDSPLRETRSDPFSKPRCCRETSCLSMIIGSMITFCVVITVAMIVQILVGAPQVTPHAGVISDDAECSKIGIRVLVDASKSTYRTASTVDAAIMTSLCLMIKNPHKGGLGGGGFMLVQKQHDAKNDTTQIIFREISPAGTVDFKVTKESVNASSTVAVPGYVAGVKEAHRLFGISPLEELFKLAAEMAEKKVNVSKDLASAIASLNLDSVDEELKKLVTGYNGSTKLVEGDKLSQPELVKTLNALSKDPDAFYTGDIAKSIVERINNGSGNLTMSDMNNYKAISNTEVLKINYKKSSIVSPSVLSSGAVVLSTLNSLEKQTENTTDSKLEYHRMLEALKYSYGHMTEWKEGSQIESSFATRFNIDDTKSYNVDHYLNGSQPLQLNSGGEQHVTVIGFDGMIVTLVIGIGSPFGSKIMESGFLLNNAMLDFSWTNKNSDDTTGLPPSQANYIAPSSMPMSSMSPVLVLPQSTKCGLYLSFDADYSEAAISALVQTVVRHGSDAGLMESVDGGRLNQNMVPYQVQVEGTVPEDLVSYLRNLGHNITQQDTLGICNVLSYLSGDVKSYMDKRDQDNIASLF